MGKKPTNRELRNEVFNLCDSLGFWNVRPSETAKKLGVTQQSASRWRLQYVEKFGIPNIERMGKELNVNLKPALKELMKIVKLGNTSQKIQAVRALFESVEKFTKFLENFGYKEKVAEKIDMGGVEFKITGIKDTYPDVEEENKEEKKE